MHPASAETGNRDRTLHEFRSLREPGQLSDSVGKGPGTKGRRGEEEVRPEAVRESGIGRSDSEHDVPGSQTSAEVQSSGTERVLIHRVKIRLLLGLISGYFGCSLIP